MQFPANFQWGAATAATQVEGAAERDGKGESIWDRFARKGKVAGGFAAVDRGSGHYDRYLEDVAIMAEMGLAVYRFSLSWSRIFPEGGGEVNQKGLDFYKGLITALREKGIQPAITLYHWDLPQALQKKGGWLNRDTAHRFADYAAAMFRTFGADVSLWITLNEPFVTTFSGHVTGEHAPGLKRPFNATQVAHHLLLGHGEAVKAFRSLQRTTAQIGIAQCLWQQEPFSRNPEDVEAARRADGMINRWFLDPVLKGRYPEDIWAWYRPRCALPEIESGDMSTIGQPIDFMGVQYYSRIVHRNNPFNLFTGLNQIVPTGVPTTAVGWEIYPEGLTRILRRLKRDYGKIPLIITGNGAAFADTVGPTGRIHDGERIRYLEAHVHAVSKAIESGVNVRGYYVWSLLDNLEWNLGADRRFGLVYVDYENMQRTWKDSAYWYRDFIREQTRR